MGPNIYLSGSMAKILLVCNGSAETAQAAAFSQYLIQQKHSPIFGLLKKDHAHYLASPNEETPVDMGLIDSPESYKALLASEAPDFVYLFNSQLFTNDLSFLENPAHNVKTFCVDTGWSLYGEGSRRVTWADKNFNVLPREIFESNLEANGGHYPIEKTAYSNTEFVGLLPSYTPPPAAQKKLIRKALQVTGDKKLIFMYFGGPSSTAFLQEHLQQIVKRLKDENIKASLMIAGASSEAQRKDNIVLLPPLDSRSFYEFLSCADLVLQHQGLTSLAQCISAEVPVICNTPNTRRDSNREPASWRVDPFFKQGSCERFEYKNFLSLGLDSLMDFFEFQNKVDEMKEAQRKLKAEGEKNLFDLSIGKL